MSEPGATILFWMHHRRGDSLLPVFIKVPPSTPVPLATVLAYGPPTYLVSSDYELSREFETELRWDPSSQSVFPRSKTTRSSPLGRQRRRLNDGREVLPPTFAHMDVKYYYDRTLRHTPPSQSSTPSIPEE
mmetsp:Transcript_17934/g.59046  ORF Transcript_17934/g.59046 Transcript_17934/m.59046 type:complete len:131 (-) Transcript_17934:308-700(-)